MFGTFRAKNDDARFDREFFTIYDSKTGIYREPMIAFNQHDILRQIHNMMQDPAQLKNPLVTNAEDYSLFMVGAYDQKSGEIRPTQPLTHIANLHDIRAAIQRTQPDPTLTPRQQFSTIHAKQGETGIDVKAYS